MRKTKSTKGINGLVGEKFCFFLDCILLLDAYDLFCVIRSGLHAGPPARHELQSNRGLLAFPKAVRVQESCHSVSGGALGICASCCNICTCFQCAAQAYSYSSL